VRHKSWNVSDLSGHVKTSYSIREVLQKLNLKPAGGNYKTVNQQIRELNLNTSHFLGQGWNKGLKFVPNKPKPLAEILVTDSSFQSFKLKKRLFKEGLKQPKCELCGWCHQAVDGRIPLELDHINGDHRDNRLKNLRILCPNCHSLQSTHRGKNKVKY